MFLWLYVGSAGAELPEALEKHNPVAECSLTLALIMCSIGLTFLLIMAVCHSCSRRGCWMLAGHFVWLSEQLGAEGNP